MGGAMPKLTKRQQTLFFQDEPRTMDATDAPKATTRVFQDFLLDEAVWAIKRAVRHEKIDSLYSDLNSNLPQNSAATRQRYTQSILK